MLGNSSPLPGKYPEIASSCPGVALQCKQPLAMHHTLKPGYKGKGTEERQRGAAKIPGQGLEEEKLRSRGDTPALGLGACSGREAGCCPGPFH